MAANANKKEHGRPLDRAGGGGYACAPMLRIAVLFSLLVVLSGCQSDQVTRLTPDKFVKHFSSQVQPAANSTNKIDGANLKPRLIAPGMEISVSVGEDRSLDKNYVVPPSGVVDFAGAGRINCIGLTADELALKIRMPLERDYFQKATVAVTIETATGSGGGGVVYVIGNVNRPGPLLLPKDESFTVTKVIIAAGNFAAFANQTSVRLIRYDENGKKFECRVNVAAIMKNGDFDKDVPVQNGDWIIVPEKMFSF